jgi:nicotinamidase-related amidase
MFRIRDRLAIAALAVALVYVTPVTAQTIIDEWANIKAPPAPELKSVTLDPKTTAFLVMDLIKQACNENARPRCVASIPKVAKLLAAARASGVTVIYTTFGNFTAADVLPDVAPKGNEPVITSFVDKFILGNKDTGLEKMLKDIGITSVIAVGTAANGAVLYTASAASLRGFNVIVPVDGMSGTGQIVYDEQAVAYTLTHAPIVSPKITLTRTDMIKF